MSGGSRIIAFGGAGEEPEGPEAQPATDVSEAKSSTSDDAIGAAEPFDLQAEWVEEDEENAPAGRKWLHRGIPVLAALVAVAWTAVFAWAHKSEFTSQTAPSQWVSLASDWAIVIAVIGVAWLLFMRNSTREAGRFGDAAALLSAESERLETRLLTVNRELSLAREFLAAQARDLESLGRMANERLATHADRLNELVRENSDRIETIERVGGAALENMEKLRGQLPVIASSAKDVTNNIGNAGRTAHAQIEDLVSGFRRINEFGQASEGQVESVRALMDQAIESFASHCERLEGIAQDRFVALNERTAELRTRLEGEEIEALAAIRNRAGALAEELRQAREALHAQEEAALDQLNERLGAMRNEGGAIADALRSSEEASLQAWRENLGRIEADRSAFFARVEEADAEALETARSRLAGLTEEVRLIEEGISERRARVAAELENQRLSTEQAETALVEGLAAKLQKLDEELAERRAAHEEHGRAMIASADTALERLTTFDEQIAEIWKTTSGAQEGLATSLQEIGGTIRKTRDSLASASSDISKLTDASVRLLELVRGGADRIRTDIPAAIANSEEQLENFDISMREMRETIETAGRNGEFLANQIASSQASLKQIIVEIAQVQFALRDRSNAFDEVLSENFRALADLERKSETVAERVRGELTDAIEKLDTSAREAVSAIGAQGAGEISALAEQLGTASEEAIEAAMRSKAAQAAGQLEQAANNAAGVSQEAARQLRDQLAIVDELVGNLEQRVSHARARAEEQVDNDFARRAALITESLNSNAIDIAKALSNEVSDTAWESYLRGDRGIFTRRAVNLIHSQDSKAIQQVFERDPGFREHVARYIHDFEAILRQVLSTRDGNALGVTLLSSDMGKLYVALAQSIDRLR